MLFKTVFAMAMATAAFALPQTYHGNCDTAGCPAGSECQKGCIFNYDGSQTCDACYNPKEIGRCAEVKGAGACFLSALHPTHECQVPQCTMNEFQGSKCSCPPGTPGTK